MRVSYNWLKDYVDIDRDAYALAELITRAGVEIDSITPTNPGMSGLVVAQVVSCEPHPDSDHLNKCVVTTDGSNAVEVVCGAANVAQRQKVIFAQVGAILPGNFEIKATKLRGENSNGMICSMQELGIPEELVAPEDKDGIRVLPEDAPLGEDAIEYLGLNDYILELDLTPNRSDCLSVYNIAKEVGALLEKEVKAIETTPIEGDAIQEKIRVEIEDPDLCHRFTATMVEGVKVARSPIWMEHRLQCAGIRPISNLVDVTNYVMLELGQPLHAYDHQTLAGPSLNVRRAHDGETIVTLDEKERELPQDALLICDADRAVGIAGIMGGENTEIRPDTQDVLIESAYFQAQNVRRTSMALGLRSEASVRNEKGINIETVGLAGWRAAQLIADLTGGQLVPGQIDRYPTPHEPIIVTLAYDKARKVIGINLASDIMRGMLIRLGFQVETEDADSITVVVPAHRPDISIPEDLIEEIARLYGYDNIPATLPYGETTPGVLTHAQKVRQQVAHFLSHNGLHEVVSYSMVSARHNDLLCLAEDDIKRQQIVIANPLSEEMSVMRTTNLPGMLKICLDNLNHKNNDIALFEIATLFFGGEGLNAKDLADEREVLSLLMVGGSKNDWLGSRKEYDFYDLKGRIEHLLGHLGIKDYRFEPVTDQATWHPGRTARLIIHGEDAGLFGELHPLVCKNYHIKYKVYAAELKMESLITYGAGVACAEELVKFPPALLDFAFVVDKRVLAQSLIQTIQEVGTDLLKSVELFDVYEGPSLPAGKKSLAVGLRFQSDTETLSDQVVQEVSDRILQAVKEQWGAELRS